jgi:hypothetical protein
MAETRTTQQPSIRIAIAPFPPGRLAQPAADAGDAAQ